MDTLYIRADATAAMGTGHIMRCLALGQAFKKKGGTIVFISHCENRRLRSRIEDEGFGFHKISCPPHDQTGLQATLRKLSNDFSAPLKKPVWVALDGCHLGPDFQKSIKDAGFRLLVVDDYNHHPRYHADILVNQNIGSENYAYNIDPGTHVLSGLTYAMLRHEFLADRCAADKNFEPPNREKINILVTMGGSDPANATPMVFNAIKKINAPGIHAKIVIGPAGRNNSKIKSMVSSGDNITVIDNGNMPRLMKWADIAICAAGSTCWELCLLGVPFMTVIVAENQETLALNLEKAGGSINLGWIHNTGEEKIAQSVFDLINDDALMKKMSLAVRRLVDGNGVDRILNQMERMN